MIQESVRDTGLLAKAAQTGVIKIWGIVLKELRGRSLLQEVLHVDDNGRFSTPPPQIYNGFLFCFLTVTWLHVCGQRVGCRRRLGAAIWNYILG